MSPERDELARLVQELPDDQVPAVLAEVRRRLEPLPEGHWPPAWFGMINGGEGSVGARSEELLADGFGR